MNSEIFVEAVKRYVRDAAVEDTITNLRRPPGRRVPVQRKDLSDWYNGLSDADAAHVKAIIATAVHTGIFGIFAVLDGARTIDDNQGRYELTYIADGRVLLNPQSINLHDLLNSE
jgi:hypothetical protein